MTRAPAVHRCIAGLIGFSFAFAASAASAEAPNAPIMVRTSAELVKALDDASAGRMVQVLRGRYSVDHPLVVHAGVTVTGEGVMHFDADGIPNGFAPETLTLIEASTRFDGDLLTLENGASVRGLALHDIADDPSAGTRRTGNAVAVVSRATGVVVPATIVECELVNPNPWGFTERGPTGRVLTIVTHSSAQRRSPHEGAAVKVGVSGSIVRAPGKDPGSAVFATNFVSGGRVEVTLTHNRIEGALVASGGVSRPDFVTGAATTIDSDHNLYMAPPGLRDKSAWLLFAGSSSPHTGSPDSPGASFNQLRMRSVADRIEGFPVGILAAGARRVFSNSTAVSDNSLDLDLTGLHVRTDGAGAADLKVYGALSEQPNGSRDFPAGDRNTLRLRLVDGNGSGVRANAYAAESGPVSPGALGVGNTIEIIGTAAQFARSNTGFEPPPPPEYFSATP